MIGWRVPEASNLDFLLDDEVKTVLPRHFELGGPSTRPDGLQMKGSGLGRGGAPESAGERRGALKLPYFGRGRGTQRDFLPSLSCSLDSFGEFWIAHCFRLILLLTLRQRIVI